MLEEENSESNSIAIKSIFDKITPSIVESYNGKALLEFKEAWNALVVSIVDEMNIAVVRKREIKNLYSLLY